MKLWKLAVQGLVVGGMNAIALGLGFGLANAAPPTPPPNPGGYYGSGYQDLIDQLPLSLNQNTYDGNGNFLLEGMFGAVCNNPGFICT
jgi:hypothetical protein